MPTASKQTNISPQESAGSATYILWFNGAGCTSDDNRTPQALRPVWGLGTNYIYYYKLTFLRELLPNIEVVGVVLMLF